MSLNDPAVVDTQVVAVSGFGNLNCSLKVNRIVSISKKCVENSTTTRICDQLTVLNNN